MLALKAKYNHGKIDWVEPPPFQGSCDLIVIFSPPEETVPLATPAARREYIRQIQEKFTRIPPDVSLVDELIAERRMEAARE